MDHPDTPTMEPVVLANTFSYTDFTKAAKLGHTTAATLLTLRQEYGRLTKDIVLKFLPGWTEEDLKSWDFTTVEGQDPLSSAQEDSQTGQASTIEDTPGDPQQDWESYKSSLYPYERYRPSESRYRRVGGAELGSKEPSGEGDNMAPRRANAPDPPIGDGQGPGQSQGHLLRGGPSGGLSVGAPGSQEDAPLHSSVPEAPHGGQAYNPAQGTSPLQPVQSTGPQGSQPGLPGSGTPYPIRPTHLPGQVPGQSSAVGIMPPQAKPNPCTPALQQAPQSGAHALHRSRQTHPPQGYGHIMGNSPHPPTPDMAQLASTTGPTAPLPVMPRGNDALHPSHWTNAPAPGMGTNLTTAHPVRQYQHSALAPGAQPTQGSTWVPPVDPGPQAYGPTPIGGNLWMPSGYQPATGIPLNSGVSYVNPPASMAPALAGPMQGQGAPPPAWGRNPAAAVHGAPPAQQHSVPAAQAPASQMATPQVSGGLPGASTNAPQRRAAMAPPRSLPKSITFNGTGNWKAFYAKFEAFGEQAGWSPLQCRNELQWCLEGAASAFHTTLVEREPSLTHKQIVAHLHSRYGFQSPPEIIQMELASARQGKDETARDWGDRVLDLATHAFPEFLDKQIQNQAVLYFCQGCFDREAGAYVLNLRPKQIQEAVELLIWRRCSYQVVFSRARMEAARAVPRALRGDECNPLARKVDTHHPPSRVEEPSGGYSPSTPTTPNTKLMDGLSKRIDCMEVQWDKRAEGLEKEMAKLAGLPKAVEELIALVSQGKPRGRSPSPSPNKSPCYGCGKLGHFRRECPMNNATKTVSFVQEEIQGNCLGLEEGGTPWPED